MSEPHIAAKKSITVEVKAGETYWYCTCGHSASQPFCDGSHKGTGMAPLKYVAEEDGKKSFCQCKHTGNSPFCDGTHKTL